MGDIILLLSLVVLLFVVLVVFIWKDRKRKETLDRVNVGRHWKVYRNVGRSHFPDWEFIGTFSGLVNSDVIPPSDHKIQYRPIENPYGETFSLSTGRKPSRDY